MTFLYIIVGILVLFVFLGILACKGGNDET